MNRKELMKSEVDQILLRTDIANKKLKTIKDLEIENQIIVENINNYLQKLINKYELDVTKNYSFDGSALVEVEEQKPIPVPKIKKSKKWIKCLG